MGKLRSWKPAAKSRASSNIAVPSLRDSLAKKMKMRAERVATLAAQKALTDEIRQEKREEREQREERERKKKENQERGIQYQVITNTSKIKKMSKKQLRTIKKADTTGVAPKQYASSQGSSSKSR